MLKGQLSTVLGWPFTSFLDAIHFPACSLGASATPHSLQLATHTELAYHYIQYALSTLSIYFFFQTAVPSEKKQ